MVNSKQPYLNVHCFCKIKYSLPFDALSVRSVLKWHGSNEGPNMFFFEKKKKKKEKSQNWPQNYPQSCVKRMHRLIESMMVLRPRQGNLRLVFRLFSLMRGLPSIRLK